MGSPGNAALMRRISAPVRLRFQMYTEKPSKSGLVSMSWRMSCSAGSLMFISQRVISSGRPALRAAWRRHQGARVTWIYWLLSPARVTRMVRVASSFPNGRENDFLFYHEM